MKTFFASLLGTLTAMVVGFLFFIIIIVALVPEEKTTRIEDKSVLHLDLSKPITERSSKNPFENLDLSGETKTPTGLNDLMACLEKAEADSNIKGIFLDVSVIPAGFATLEEIRNGLIKFKKSGKFVYAYSEIYTQKAYYLATVADKVFLNPQGIIEHKGLSAQIMFLKGLLEKADIDAQIFRHGKFKSAIEPLMLDKMSDANRKQVEVYIGSIWNHVLNGISTARKIEVAELNRLADEMVINNAGACISNKLADDTLYRDQVMDLIRTKLDIKEKDKVNLVTLAKYTKAPSKKKDKLSKNKVAVIYAVGDIESGEGDDETIGSERISRSIREARIDSTIKAIVLRVNSPGGSALASDVIWREVVLANKVKPVIVSMGDVAASGGYYISCGADYIFAQPNTITGSIGVFGILPNLSKMYKNKFGITIDTANTNKHADLGTLNRAVMENERSVIQDGVESVYTTFIGRVASGRKKSSADIDSIGQGRVWTGADALNIGLVDALGGIEDAIAYAVKKANLDGYRIINLPKQKDPFEELMKELSGKSDETVKQILQREMGSSYQYIKLLKTFSGMKGVQARMPYEVIFE
jgi:protease IV